MSRDELTRLFYLTATAVYADDEVLRRCAGQAALRLIREARGDAQRQSPTCLACGASFVEGSRHRCVEFLRTTHTGYHIGGINTECQACIAKYFSEPPASKNLASQVTPEGET